MALHEQSVGASDEPQAVTPAVYALASRRLIEARTEVKRLTDFLEMYRQFADPSQRLRSVPAVRSVCAVPQRELQRLCVEILRQSVAPMGWKALHGALAAGGHVVDGRSPRSRIVTAMWRLRPLVDHDDRGYFLSSEAQPLGSSEAEDGQHKMPPESSPA